MNNLKSLVHTTHSELKKTIPTIKKSHLYEAIASYCGFRSYAAYQKPSFFDKTQITDDEQAKGQCFERMLEIAFNAEDALVISQSMTNLWEKLSDRRLDDIWHFYVNTGYEERLLSSDVLTMIKPLVVSGDLEAKLISLVLTTEVLAEYQEDPDNRSAEYWHEKRITGNSLNGLQAEVANNYLHIQCYREFMDFLCSSFLHNESSILPSSSVINAFTNKFDKSSKREWTSFFCDDPYTVVCAIEFIQNYRDTEHSVISENLYLDWYKAEVFLNPNKEMLADIIESSISDEEKWAWYYFGLVHNIDVTQDAHVAINSDTGEDWDGYGPAVVGGYSGISLPEISDPLKEDMQKAATSVMS